MDPVTDQIWQAFQAGIAAVQPQDAIQKLVSLVGDRCQIAGQEELNHKSWPTTDLRVLTVGKAAGAMAEALNNILGAKISQGLIIAPQLHLTMPTPWQILVGNHPLPGVESWAAGQAVRQLLQNCTSETLLLVGVSGGATALVVDPPTPIRIETLRSIYQSLLASGADIQEMNAVRSRLDQLKAGGLVTLAAPAQVVGLILSDVVGDSVAVIGSGLTYHLAAHNTLIGSNQQACVAAATALANQGYQVLIVTHTLVGEAQLQGQQIAQAVEATSPGTALIYGGETTVTLPSNCVGQGGRNQELVLAAAIALQNSNNCWVGSIGTDGIDGTSLAAGAIANSQTIAMAVAQGLDPIDHLQRHDSGNFFDQLQQSIVTGPTGTNVADLMIAIHAH
jgi:glycerate 2-kinase